MTIADNGRGLLAGLQRDGTTGVGPAMVKALVTKDLAGTLQLSNRAEGGSQATLTFYK